MFKRFTILSSVAAAMMLVGFQCLPTPPPPVDVPPVIPPPVAGGENPLDLVMTPPGGIIYTHPMGGVSCPDPMPSVTIFSPDGTFDTWQLNDAPPWVDWPDSGPIGEPIDPLFNCQVPGLGEYSGEIKLSGFMSGDKENTLSDSLIINVQAKVVPLNED